jgi:hypothetical protein
MESKMSEEALTKVCTKCGIEKPLEEFGKQALGKHGRQARCRACIKAYDAARHSNSYGKTSKSNGCMDKDNCKSKSARLCRSCSIKKLHENNDFAERRDNRIASLTDPKYLEMAREKLFHLRANDPNWVDKQNELLADARDRIDRSKQREAAGEELNRRWQSSEYKSQHSTRMRKLHAERYEDRRRDELEEQMEQEFDETFGPNPPFVPK